MRLELFRGEDEGKGRSRIVAERVKRVEGAGCSRIGSGFAMGFI